MEERATLFILGRIIETKPQFDGETGNGSGRVGILQGTAGVCRSEWTENTGVTWSNNVGKVRESLDRG